MMLFLEITEIMNKMIVILITFLNNDFWMQNVIILANGHNISILKLFFFGISRLSEIMRCISPKRMFVKQGNKDAVISVGDQDNDICGSKKSCWIDFWNLGTS